VKRQAPYPKHFVEDALPIDVAVFFETPDGERVDTAVSPLLAGARGTWLLRLTNSGADLATGAALCVVRFNCQFAFELQCDRPTGRDFCTVETGSSARLELGVGRDSINLITVGVQAGVWLHGESATVRLGDRRQGSVGSEVFWSATDGRLLVGLDREGSGTFRGVHGNPFDFQIVAQAQPRLLRLLGPSVVAADEPFGLHLGVFDRNRNPIQDFTGSVELRAPEGIHGLPPHYTFSPSDHGVRIFSHVHCSDTGVQRIQVSGPGGTFLSNPILVQRDPTQRVYWGDVHAHGWGDSTMYLMHLRSDKLDPLQRHLQARDLGRHDFSCPGAMSMDPQLRPETWEAYRQAFAQVDEPGRFIPFLSYEAHPAAGDRQVIFRADEPTPPSMRLPMDELDALYGQRDDVLLEVHVGGAPPLWDSYRPARERLVEVCSGFGAAEWLLQKALQLGYRPAVCAASDLHLGYLGGPRAVETFRGRFGQKYPMRQRDAAFGTGPLTAVCASELTRDALWESMTTGRTYATSGARIFLDLAVNGDATATRLGAEDLNGGLRLTLDCHACAPIRRMALICGKYRLHTWEPASLDVHEELKLSCDQLPGSWLYVRVEQIDGEYAWSRVVYLDGLTPPAAAVALPAWNNEVDPDLGAAPPNAASDHLPELRGYLQREEESQRFHDLTPMGVLELDVGRCALFYCRWVDEQLPMSIRWFHEFDIPKIRFDFGWRDYGIYDELELGPRLMSKYT
jgi:uncharacterized protein DUF3604